MYGVLSLGGHTTTVPAFGRLSFDAASKVSMQLPSDYPARVRYHVAVILVCVFIRKVSSQGSYVHACCSVRTEEWFCCSAAGLLYGPSAPSSPANHFSGCHYLPEHNVLRTVLGAVLGGAWGDGLGNI